MEKEEGCTWLLTGGSGYIGSHTVIELYNWLVRKEFQGSQITIIDNLSNSSEKVLARIEQIIQQENPTKKPPFFRFIKQDLLNFEALQEIFKDHEINKKPIRSIIHFAGKKSVNESVQKPLQYQENNLISTLNLLKCMEIFNCKNLIFSSSASVYGMSKNCTEETPMDPMHPYSGTKVCIEQMLKHVVLAHQDWGIVSLRYFNPCGSHPSGLIGDSPTNFPNNLFPYVQDVAIGKTNQIMRQKIGKREFLKVFGNDWKTPDGTGVRDYLHIVDLAKGHINALEYLGKNKGQNVFNLGSGKGQSVLDIVNTYSKVIGKQIPQKIAERRPGDVDSLIANVEKSKKELNWEAQKTLEEMCKDSYNYITKNPEGIK